MKQKLSLGEILNLIPHRYPFLLVDKILEQEKNKIVGVKNVTINEPFFQGHFPGHPVMPGVLIIEAMAQTGGVLMFSKEENKGKIPLLAGIDKARFKKPVYPGDQLKIEVEIIKMVRGVGKAKAEAYVDDHLAASAELLFTAV
ncbi:3-hydroxyacyl-[acyl-carrier-protein] dehydratase FabZ [Candidatus Atribacteria bacterium RBG_16_35_8]|nr:MAG: 3-hydroxyacyl-[acyl-carrier-protein] dehydratase FabZ [Candidatus Atribacteria bacterium RBG_16_35_8]